MIDWVYGCARWNLEGNVRTNTTAHDKKSLRCDAFEGVFLCLLRNAAEGDLDGVWVRHEDETSERGWGEGDLDVEGEEPVRLCTGTYNPDCLGDADREDEDVE